MSERLCGKKDPVLLRPCILPRAHLGDHEDNHGKSFKPSMNKETQCAQCDLWKDRVEQLKDYCIKLRQENLSLLEQIDLLKLRLSETNLNSSCVKLQSE